MRYCENCSRPIADGYDACPRCGAADKNTLSGTSRILLVLLSIFISPAGIIAGIVYMTKDLKQYRIFGKKLLIISLISLTSFIICCCVFYMYFINNFYGGL